MKKYAGGVAKYRSSEGKCVEVCPCHDLTQIVVPASFTSLSISCY